MPNWLTAIGVLVSWFVVVLQFAAPASATQPCGGAPGWDAAEVTVAVRNGEEFVVTPGPWSFVLEPKTYGWRIAMRDAEGELTPVGASPARPIETNPLNVAGWHFRNKDNLGPNTGTVNAPQHVRRFRFDDFALSNVAPTTDISGQSGGLGEFVITAMELSPPQAGTRARFERLEAKVCLVWVARADRLPPIVDADPGVAFASVIAEMKGCGLDSESYKLSDRMAAGSERGQAPFLRPDLDRDNIPDLVVPVTRRADKAPGLAICLIGDETLLLAGYSGFIGRHLHPDYFQSVDWWALHQGPIRPGAGEASPPRLYGDAILLGKGDSSSALLFLDADGALSSYWQGD